MQKRLPRYLSIAVLPVFLAAALAGCGKTANADVVATYNGGNVTKPEFDKFVSIMTLANPSANLSSSATQQQMLQQYIVINKILAKKAAAAGFKSSSATVQSDVQQFKNQIQQAYGSASAYDQKLKTLKLTDADVAKVIGDQFTVEEYAGSQIPQSALEAYYKQNLKNYTVTTQHGILVKSKATAETVYQLLQKDNSNTSWDKLAKQYSQDPGSSSNGGVYANQPASNWVGNYAKAVMTQPLNVVGQPFHTTYGWFVVEVTARKIEPFSTVKSEVESQVLNDSSSKYGSTLTNMMSQAQSTANIKITLPKSSTSS